MDAQLHALAKLGAAYKVRRRTSPALFRDDLIALLHLEFFNWTSPYGRAYLYEFFIERGPLETSLLVEISDVAQVAFVYFGYRRNASDGSYADECGDIPRDSQHEGLRKTAMTYLEQRGYNILPYESSRIRFGDKTLRELLIDDPED